MKHTMEMVGTKDHYLCKGIICVFVFALILWNSPGALAIGEVSVKCTEDGENAPWVFPVDEDGSVSFKAEVSGLLDANDDGETPDADINWGCVSIVRDPDGDRRSVVDCIGFESHENGTYITFDVSTGWRRTGCEMAIEVSAWSNAEDKKKASFTYRIAKVTSVAPLAGHSEVGVDTSPLTKGDFNITTSPYNDNAEHSLATWSGFPDMSTPGTYTVTAEIGDSSKSCEVEVSDGWIHVLERPSFNAGFNSTQHVETWTTLDGLEVVGYKLESTAEGSNVHYDIIDQGNYDYNGSFTTTCATQKNQEISTSGEVGFNAYGVGATVTVSTTIGWQTSQTHEMETTGGDSDYQYYARHSQGAVNIILQHEKYRQEDAGDPWNLVDSSTSTKGISGLNVFHKDKWKKSASLSAGDAPCNPNP